MKTPHELSKEYNGSVSHEGRQIRDAFVAGHMVGWDEAISTVINEATCFHEKYVVFLDKLNMLKK